MRWRASIGRLGLLGLLLGGCEDGFDARCLVVLGGDGCFDGTEDGSVDDDAGASDAGAIADSGMDAGSDAGGLASSLSSFCERQFANARAFLDSCNCVESADRDKVNAFVQDVLLYRGIDACVENVTRLVATMRFEPAAATGCAQRFDAQFALPPMMSRCTAGGIDIQLLEAAVGKGAQFLAQIPECRQAFVGTIARDGACTTSLECAGGLRCLPMPGLPVDQIGGARTCQSPRSATAPCASNSDCADGLVCSGVAVPGRTCIEADALRPVGAACQASLECTQDWICFSNQCAMPVVDVVCRQ